MRRVVDGAGRVSWRCSPAGSSTESGRQPYTVYGLLRTADIRLADRGAGRRRLRLSPFVVVYVAVFGAGVFYILRLMRGHLRKGCEAPILATPSAPAGITPARCRRRRRRE